MDKCAYKPMMSDHEIGRRRVWQEKVYEELLKPKTPGVVTVGKDEFITLPGMFAPRWMDSSLFAEVLSKKITSKDFVLDLGTGSGIQVLYRQRTVQKLFLLI